MKLNRLFIIFIALGVAASSCKKDSKGLDSNETPPTDTGNPSTPVPTAYAITETFESGSKAAYADAAVTLLTGQWDFNDAVLGNLAADAKDGNWSVRLRTGSISTLFDINGLTKIVVKHAKYGSDGASTWKMMMSADGGNTYTQLGNDINETSTTLVADSFTVSTTAKVRIKIQKTGTTRINIDDITFKGTGDPGITTGTDTDPGDDSGNTSTPAGARSVNPGADAPPASGDNSNLLLGNPSNAQAVVAMNTNYLINTGYYIESYNSTKSEPNWVSWHLDASNTTHVTDRLDNFAAYADLPAGFTAVQSNSFSGSGFDRGHNCPSADRTSSTEANSSTFLMINMIPQAPNNNQKTWANLENDLREQVLEGNEVYIIMGSYGTGGIGSKAGTVNTITSGNVSVNVPSHVWKVAVIIPTGNGDLARITSNTRVIAVDTPNDNTIQSDWKKYITTVRAIEQAMGNNFNLLSALPQGVQDIVEIKADSGS